MLSEEEDVANGDVDIEGFKFNEDPRAKDSPLRIQVHKELIGYAKGDGNHDEFEIRTESSHLSISVIDVVVEPDDDFIYLRDMLADSNDNWELAVSTDLLKVQKLRNLNGTQVTLRCQALLPKVSKKVAFNAFSDMKLRAKWD